MDLILTITLMVSVFILSLSGALMPGPVLVLTISESVKKGFIAGPLIVLGHIIVESIIIASLLLGLGGIIQLEPVLIIIGILGGSALTWMGYSLLNVSYKAQISISKEIEKAESVTHDPIVGGIITSLSNPYFFLWWATIGIGLISLFIRSVGAISLLAVALFATSHWMSDLIWYSVVSFSIGKGRKKFMNDKTYRTVIGFCGIFLLVFGAYFVLDAIRTLLI